MSLTQWLKTGKVQTRSPILPGLPDPADSKTPREAITVQVIIFSSISFQLYSLVTRAKFSNLYLCLFELNIFCMLVVYLSNDFFSFAIHRLPMTQLKPSLSQRRENVVSTAITMMRLVQRLPGSQLIVVLPKLHANLRQILAVMSVKQLFVAWETSTLNLRNQVSIISKFTLFTKITIIFVKWPAVKK